VYGASTSPRSGKVRNSVAVDRLMADYGRSLQLQCERYGVKHLSLFGSVLRDDFDDSTSDLDFARAFRSPVAESLARQYFDFKGGLAQLFGRPVDLAEIGVMQKSRMKRIIEHTRISVYTCVA
jgi:predicted nucleotidyltransferase